MSGSEHARPVWLTKAQRDYLRRRGFLDPALQVIVDAWDAAPEDAWSEIAAEFKSHRCKDGNCFAETVMMRLGALPAGNPSSPFGF